MTIFRNLKITCHDNGKIHTQGHYELGKKEGAWEIFNDEGTLLKRETWHNGKLWGIVHFLKMAQRVMKRVGSMEKAKASIVSGIIGIAVGECEDSIVKG